MRRRATIQPRRTNEAGSRARSATRRQAVESDVTTPNKQSWLRNSSIAEKSSPPSASIATTSRSTQRGSCTTPSARAAPPPRPVRRKAPAGRRASQRPGVATTGQSFDVGGDKTRRFSGPTDSACPPTRPARTTFRVLPSATTPSPPPRLHIRSTRRAHTAHTARSDRPPPASTCLLALRSLHQQPTVTPLKTPVHPGLAIEKPDGRAQPPETS